MHLPNPAIRSHYRNGFIKQYVRDHLILRTETATSRHRLRKAVDNLPTLRTTLSSINDNYLNEQQDIRETFIDRRQLRRLARPAISAAGKHTPGLKLDNPRQLPLMHALVSFSHVAANGFTTTEFYTRVRDTHGAAANLWRVLVRSRSVFSDRRLHTPGCRGRAGKRCRGRNPRSSAGPSHCLRVGVEKSWGRGSSQPT